MKLDWTVRGSIKYRDGTEEGFSGEWPARSMAEADRLADETVAEQMRRRKVYGVSITASARGKDGHSIIMRQQWK